MSVHYDEAITSITQTVFSTMLQIDLVQSDPSEQPVQDALVTAIQITGEWVGSVMLSLSPGTAQSAAAAMLQIPLEEVTKSDQQEVAAELVNIIGGNLKSLLPGSLALSLPTIVAGSDFIVRIHTATLLEDVWLGSEEGWLRVRLYQKCLNRKEEVRS